MGYIIYGKHIKPWRDNRNILQEPEKQFRALDKWGMRTNRKDAYIYATKEEAQSRIDKVLARRDDVSMDIRLA